MVPDCARRQLVSVADDVVLPRLDLERILVFQRVHLALRHRERVVAEVDLLRVLVIFEHREIDDPAELEAAFLDQAQLFGHAGARGARQLGGVLFLTRREEEAVVFAQAEFGIELFHAFGAVVLGDRATKFAALASDVAKPGEALAPCPVVHLVEELAALLMRVRRGDHAHAPAAAHDLLEQAEARSLKVFGHVRDDQRVAQIGLVAAVFQHRFGVGNARKFASRGHALAVCEFLEHARQHRLDSLEDVFLRDETHLEVELVEFGAAVCAQVFITETGCDLEIAIEAGDHQQLLEHLRRLRERVEAARVQAAGHEVVACALGARGAEDRRLELAETLVGHAAAQRGDNPVAQHDVGMHSLAAQVDETILEAGFLGIVLRRIDNQRQVFRAALHADFAREDLDLARRQVCIDRHIGARLDRAVDGDHRFQLDPVEDRQRRAVFIRDDLGDAVMIAQIDEQHAAMIALVVHPTRQANGVANIILGQLGAGMGTIGVHEKVDLSAGME